jgi:hypothetical protein
MADSLIGRRTITGGGVDRLAIPLRDVRRMEVGEIDEVATTSLVVGSVALFFLIQWSLVSYSD